MDSIQNSTTRCATLPRVSGSQPLNPFVSRVNACPLESLRRSPFDDVTELVSLVLSRLGGFESHLAAFFLRHRLKPSLAAIHSDFYVPFHLANQGPILFIGDFQLPP